MTPDALSVAAVVALMMIWWLTEAVPLAVTALVPLVVFPFTGIMDVDTAATAYADPVIFLYLGGFILAITMERWGLHQRIALNIVQLVGSNANTVIGGFMLATALLSMWISNTATVVMMLPISLSVVHLLMRKDAGAHDEGAKNFATCMMLGLAYAASIGGVGTIIGTPPNAVFAGYMRTVYDVEIGFAQWMLLAVPIATVMLFLCWRVLLLLYPNRMGKIEGADRIIDYELRKLSGWSRGEKMIAVIFGGTALLWMFRPAISAALPGIALNDAGIAVMGALLVFLVPLSFKEGRALLTWKEAERLPWGVLLLFGGGLCLCLGGESKPACGMDWCADSIRGQCVRIHADSAGGRCDCAADGIHEQRCHHHYLSAHYRGFGSGLRLCTHRPDGSGNAGGELRFHDAGGHPAQCGGLRQRPCAHPPNGSCGHLAEYSGHRACSRFLLLGDGLCFRTISRSSARKSHWQTG